jgi:hypothetical protein
VHAWSPGWFNPEENDTRPVQFTTLAIVRYCLTTSSSSVSGAIWSDLITHTAPTNYPCEPPRLSRSVVAIDTRRDRRHCLIAIAHVGVGERHQGEYKMERRPMKRRLAILMSGLALASVSTVVTAGEAGACSVYANAPYAQGAEIRGVGGASGCGISRVTVQLWFSKVGPDALVATGSGSNPAKAYGSCRYGRGSYYTYTQSSAGNVSSGLRTLC